MTKWELHFVLSPFFRPKATKVGPDVGALWEEHGRDGRTAIDELNDLGAEGWELVAVTPIDTDANTRQLLFTFRRPLA
jgi:hypothetical protein